MGRGCQNEKRKAYELVTDRTELNHEKMRRAKINCNKVVAQEKKKKKKKKKKRRRRRRRRGRKHYWKDYYTKEQLSSFRVFMVYITIQYLHH